jgi:hypothetical protein
MDIKLLNLYTILPHQVQQTWPKVENMLRVAIEHSGGEYTLDHLKVMLTQGKQVLLVLADENMEIKCAFSVEWINYPNDRVAFITAVGGKTCRNAFDQFCVWAREQGGTKIQGAAFEAVARLWRRAYGFENRYIIVEKRI